MSEKPEALRLADALDEKWHRWKDDPTDELKAAAELRRLHRFEVSANEWIKKTEWVQETATCKELGYHRADVIKQRFDRLIAQRGELLEALREVFSLDASLIRDIYGSEFVDRASAAIAKATGETK